MYAVSQSTGLCGGMIDQSAERAKRRRILEPLVRQLIFGMAVAIGLSAVAVSAIGGAVAQSAERAPTLTHDGVISGYDSASFEGGGRLGDRQQLKHYFLDGSRDRLK